MPALVVPRARQEGERAKMRALTTSQAFGSTNRLDPACRARKPSALARCSERSTGGCLARVGGGSQSQLGGDRLERRDHEGDVLVEVDAKLVGALVDLAAIDFGGEGGLFQLLAHRLRLERVDAVGAHQPAGVHEAGQLVAGEDRLLQRGLARYAGVDGVREDRPNDLLGVALLAQYRGAGLRVLLERGVNLVVEVVQKPGDAPELFVRTEPPRIGSDSRFDRECVPPQRLALGVLRQRRPGLLACRCHQLQHNVLPAIVSAGHVPVPGTRTWPNRAEEARNAWA